MPSPDDRIAELMAAALAGELTASEAEEFDRLRREHPWIDEELRDLGVLAERLRRGDVEWTSPRDLAALGARIAAAVPGDPTALPQEVDAAPPPRRRWVLPSVAAACLVVGVVLGVGVPALTSQPPSGPPGTLGAIEAIDVRDDLAGVDVDAELVAHTWGTEAILEATGLDIGATYAVVFVGPDGAEFSAGEILGSEVPIVCRMNAAVLRGDTVRMEIRDAADAIVAHADLPET